MCQHLKGSFQNFNFRTASRILVLYLGGFWAIVQVLDFLINRLNWNAGIIKPTLIAGLALLPSVIFFAWQRGQDGHDRVVRREVIIFSINLAIVVGLVLFNFAPGQTSAAMDSENMAIAVLPFSDLSPNKDQEYFTDGMTEQIISSLSRLKNLRVIARTSMMKYRGTTKTIAQIGHELNVNRILEGSVRKAGDKVRITVSLINTNDQSEIWAKDYDELLTDIFSVEDNVSLGVVKALQSPGSAGFANILKEGRPEKIAAYDYYLKGNYFTNKLLTNFKIKDYKEAEKQYKKAIDIDSTYALAYSGLSRVYDYYMYTNYWQGKPLEPGEQMSIGLKRDSCVEKAYALNNSLPQVLMEKGADYFSMMTPETNNYDSAFFYLRKGYEASPNDADINIQLGRFYNVVGLTKTSLRYGQKARELSPVSPVPYMVMAASYLDLGKLDEAEQNAEEALQFDPQNVLLLQELFFATVGKKDYTKASTVFDRIKSANPNETWYPYQADLFAISGQKDKALKLQKSSEIYLLLGMNKEALVELIKSGIYWSYLGLANNPIYDPIRADPQFKLLLEDRKKVYDERLAKYMIILPVSRG